MKARFTDEQIIAIIKEQESGEKTADVSAARDQFCDVLQIQIEVWRNGTF